MWGQFGLVEFGGERMSDLLLKSSRLACCEVLFFTLRVGFSQLGPSEGRGIVESVQQPYRPVQRPSVVYWLFCGYNRSARQLACCVCTCL